MPTVAQMAVNLIARSQGLEQGLQRATAGIRNFANETKAVQTQIGRIFSGAGPEANAAIREGMELRERIYRASHSNLQIMLRDHEEYFATLRQKWQGNEEMLTLISRTQSAERKRIIEDYGRATHRVFGIQVTGLAPTLVWMTMRFGFAAYFLSRSVRGTTEAIHRMREGSENLAYDMMRAIPGIGAVQDALEALGGEIYDTKTAIENLAKAEKLLPALGELRQELRRRAEFLLLPESHRRGFEIEEEYRAGIKRIYEMAEALRAAKKEATVAPGAVWFEKWISRTGQFFGGLGLTAKYIGAGIKQEIELFKSVSTSLEKYISELSARETELERIRDIQKEQSLRELSRPHRELINIIKEFVWGLQGEGKELGAVEKQFVGLIQQVQKFGGTQVLSLHQIMAIIAALKEARPIIDSIEKRLADKAALENIKKINDELQRRVDLFGATEKQQALYDLARQAQKLSPEGLDEFNQGLTETIRLLDDLEQKNLAKKLADEWANFANQVRESIKTPLEKTFEYFDKIDEAFERGLLSYQEWVRASMKAEEDLARQLEKGMGGREEETYQIGQFKTYRPALVSYSSLLLGGRENIGSKIDRTNEILMKIYGQRSEWQ